METSPECRALYEQQKTVWQALDRWEPIEPSLDFNRRLYEKIEADAANRSWFAGLFPNLRPSFAVGLAGLLLAAGTVLYHQPGTETVPRKTAGIVAVDDSEYLDQIHTALDDIEMLADFDVLPLGG